MAEARAPHVVLLSSPGMGHLFPITEFAKRLVLDHGFTATIITYTDFNSTSQLHSFFTALPPSISSLSLPSVPLDDLPPETRMEARLCVLAARSAPSVKSLLLSLATSTNLVAYVTDIFGFDTFRDARDIGVPTYMLFTSNYFMLSFMFHLPTLDAATSCEFRDLPEPLQLPGCVPLLGADFLDPIEHRSDPAYPWIVRMARLFRDCDGILVNSFLAMEPDAARVLSEEEAGRPPVLPVGPIIRSDSGGGGSGKSEYCVTWLSEQPRGSVLFVSFGSGGSISCEQTKELALGLESSGQRFLWVIRTPSDSVANAAFFGVEASDDPLDCLPEGFLSRTRSSGLVVPNWAPQMEVLAHDAVGGFLSHCGWNSTLESVVHGVPMIAWPLYAEQRMNAVMLAEGAKVALRPKVGEKGLVGREEICEVVKELMEGEEGRAVRDRVFELKKAGIEAICEGGTSYSALAGVVKKWKYIET